MTPRTLLTLSICTLLATACGDKDDAEDLDGDGFTADEDCDDDNEDINPDADESCNGEDDDCDGEVDEDPTDGSTFFTDADGDGFGDEANPAVACELEDGLVEDATDCDDTVATVFPGADETCNSVDDDCNGDVDDDPIDGSTFYTDADADGFGDADAPNNVCEQGSDQVEDATDCDDTNDAVFPGADEICNGTDDDCDDDIDEDDAIDASTWYADLDGDGFGDEANTAVSCEAPSDYTDVAGDCDDEEEFVNPDATETCNGIDDDCDSSTSEDNTVSFLADGATALVDLTSSFSSGSSSSPASVTLSDDGLVTFCDGTYYVGVEIEADVQLTSLSGGAVLDGAQSTSIVNIVTDGLTVELSDLALQNGSGTGAAFTEFGYSATGGGINCVAESALSLDTVTIQDSIGDLGGGIATYGCSLEMTDSELTGNAADFGGGAILGYSADTITDTLVSANEATSGGGGMYIYSGALDLDGTLLSENTAAYGAGAFIDASDLSCTGDTSATEGFSANVNTESDGGALWLNGGTFTATDCDFGETGSSDDNSDYDISASDGYPFVFGDDANFTCADDRCGTLNEVDTGAQEQDFSFTEVFRGNVFTVNEDTTLDSFAFYLGLSETCDVDFYVHLYDSSAATWSVLWSDAVSHPSGTDYLESGEVGVVLYSGEQVSLGWATLCDVDFYGTDYDAGEDFGFGVWDQLITYAQTYEGFDSGYTDFAEYAGNDYPYDIQIAHYTE